MGWRLQASFLLPFFNKQKIWSRFVCIIPLFVNSSNLNTTKKSSAHFEHLIISLITETTMLPKSSYQNDDLIQRAQYGRVAVRTLRKWSSRIQMNPTTLTYWFALEIKWPAFQLVKMTNWYLLATRYRSFYRGRGDKLKSSSQNGNLIGTEWSGAFWTRPLQRHKGLRI